MKMTQSIWVVFVKENCAVFVPLAVAFTKYEPATVLAVNADGEVGAEATPP